MTGQDKNLALRRKTTDLYTQADDHLSATKSTFGPHGWTIIFLQALMFWIAAGSITHGLNVILPALSRNFNLDYNALLALATPASDLRQIVRKEGSQIQYYFLSYRMRPVLWPARLLGDINRIHRALCRGLFFWYRFWLRGRDRPHRQLVYT
jgi:hypothetical protein